MINVTAFTDCPPQFGGEEDMVNGTWEGCEMPSRMSAALRPHRGVMTLAGPPATSGSGARRAYRGSWYFSGGLRAWGSARLLHLRLPRDSRLMGLLLRAGSRMGEVHEPQMMYFSENRMLSVSRTPCPRSFQREIQWNGLKNILPALISSEW